MKLYVVGNRAMRIYGHGQKAPGDYFDLPEEIAREKAQQPEFSLAPPRPARPTNEEPNQQKDDEL